MGWARVSTIASVLVVAACGRWGFANDPTHTDAHDDRDGGSDGSDGSSDAVTDGDPGAPRILFVRGGPGTLGYLNPGGDANAGDVFDHTATQGWGALADALIADGFVVDQKIEGPVSAPAAADLSGLGIYDVIVFGSNNYAYDTAAADAVEAFVRAGGGVLFISDAGFCLTAYNQAADSDQVFMTRFDLAMTQDVGGGVTINASSFTMPGHPVFAGVTSFSANGTSAISVTNNVADVTPQVLARKTGQIRRNIGETGPLVQAGPNDAALVVATVGGGRVAGLFDRDIWVNNRLGSQSNRTLAIGVFQWLAQRR